MPSVAGRMHDPGQRRRAVRKQRERGCWVYIAAEQLQEAGVDPHDERPWYKVSPGRSERRGRFVVTLYREP
jgi:hypothetical protein